jgi:DNA-binding MarR family transcriptional regulator
MSNTDPVVSALHDWIEVFMRRSMRNFLRFARENGLSMSQLSALLHLHHKRIGVTDLGDHLGVTSAAASQMLERLVQQGLILRREDPNDRRVKQIALTDKGCQILEESIHARHGWVNGLGETLTEPEKEQIIGALNLLIEKAIRLDPPIDLDYQSRQ